MTGNSSTSGKFEFYFNTTNDQPYMEEKEFVIGHYKFLARYDIPRSYPKNVRIDNIGNVFVKFLQDVKENVTAKCHIYKDRFYSSKSTIILNRFQMKNSAKFCYDRGEYATICIEVNIQEDENEQKLISSTSEKEIFDTKDCEKLKSPFLSYMANLFRSEKWSDVTVCVQGTNFPAHRNILAATSPVFASMFSENSKENLTSKIEISDFQLQTILEMVRFMYTGDNPSFQFDTCAMELYSASDKYSVDELKIQCRQKLSSSLSTSNALKVLVLAEMHSDDNLKEYVLDFICENPSSVSDTDECMEIIQKRPELLRYILECKHK